MIIYLHLEKADSADVAKVNHKLQPSKTNYSNSSLHDLYKVLWRKMTNTPRHAESRED